MANIFGFDAATVTAFGKAYVASKPPEIQALFVGTAYAQGPEQAPLDAATRYQMAMAAAKKGISADGKTAIIVDANIDAMGADPLLEQADRQEDGYTWVPSMIQPNVPVPPGVNFPGVTPYDPNNPPAGSIKVSTNIADYPAYVPPPAPSEPVTPVLYVGALIRANWYALTVAAVAAFNAGSLPSTWQEGGHTYQLQIVPFLMGSEKFWEQTA